MVFFELSSSKIHIRSLHYAHLNMCSIFSSVINNARYLLHFTKNRQYSAFLLCAQQFVLLHLQLTQLKIFIITNYEFTTRERIVIMYPQMKNEYK